MVHELNNPLTSITVYAEYLVRKLESQGAEETDVEKLRRIGASAQRILRFSRDLVQYARPSGRDLEPVDLSQVVRQPQWMKAAFEMAKPQNTFLTIGSQEPL